MPNDDDEEFHGMMSVKPDPDPTLLTTKQLLREILMLKDFFQMELKGAIATIEEKFNGVEAKFVSGEANKKLALDAAEKAAGKSEMSFTKLIDGLASRIDELRDAQKTTEGNKQGAGETRQGSSEFVSHLVTLAALAVAIVALFVKHS